MLGARKLPNGLAAGGLAFADPGALGEDAGPLTRPIETRTGPVGAGLWGLGFEAGPLTLPIEGRTGPFCGGLEPVTLAEPVLVR